MTTIRALPRPLAVLGLVLVALLAHVGILANPGYFSHDEWERLDFIRTHGLGRFLAVFAVPHAGPDFGHPMRPIGFVQQGLVSLWMEAAPLLVHGVSVLLHAAGAVALFLAVESCARRRDVALVAALAFALSPLATTATGWVGASFDQWYVLFAILTLQAGWRLLEGGASPRLAPAIILPAAAALLSKEAAVMLPAAGVLLAALAWLHLPAARPGMPARAAWLLGLLALPVLAYLALRLPALAGTLAGRGNAAYAPGTGTVPYNLLAYLAYPFLPARGDFPGLARSLPATALALASHAALVAALWWRFGLGTALLYLAGYVVFLVPVLPLSVPQSHYLHGSAIAMSLAIGFLVPAVVHGRRPLPLAAAGLGGALLLVTNGAVQARLYRDGRCQAVFLASTAGRMAAPDVVAAGLAVVEADPRARGWVGQRALHQRAPFSGTGGLPRVTFLPEGGRAPAGAVGLRMGPDCVVR